MLSKINGKINFETIIAEKWCSVLFLCLAGIVFCCQDKFLAF